MRKLLVLILLLISICLPVQANEQNIANSFIEHVNTIVKPIQDSYNGVHFSMHEIKSAKEIKFNGYYYRSTFTNFKYAYDIRKTDSILNPYLGVLEMSNDMIEFAHSTDFDIALNTKEISEKFIPYQVCKFYYHLKNGNWMLASYEEKDEYSNKWYSNNVQGNENNLEYRIMKCRDDF